MSWNHINRELPPELETVWACNPETGSVSLACVVYVEDGWLWAVSNGMVYSEDGKIISECVCDDQYDFTHWMALPSLPDLPEKCEHSWAYKIMFDRTGKNVCEKCGLITNQ